MFFVLKDYYKKSPITVQPKFIIQWIYAIDKNDIEYYIQLIKISCFLFYNSL